MKPRVLTTADPAEAIAWGLKKLQLDRTDLSEMGVDNTLIRWLNRAAPEFQLERVDYWNPSDRLPLVGVGLEILVDGEKVRCMRTSYVSKSTDDLEYVRDNGPPIRGRYRWRIP